MCATGAVMWRLQTYLKVFRSSCPTWNNEILSFCVETTVRACICVLLFRQSCIVIVVVIDKKAEIVFAGSCCLNAPKPYEKWIAIKSTFIMNSNKTNKHHLTVWNNEWLISLELSNLQGTQKNVIVLLIPKYSANWICLLWLFFLSIEPLMEIGNRGWNRRILEPDFWVLRVEPR